MNETDDDTPNEAVSSGHLSPEAWANVLAVWKQSRAEHQAAVTASEAETEKLRAEIDKIRDLLEAQGDPDELSERERVLCAELRCDPRTFVRLRAIRDGRK